MPTITAHFAPFAERMQADGLPELFIRRFAYYYDQLVHGDTGLIAETEIVPVSTLPDADALSLDVIEVGKAALPKTAVIKLNGGLGTSMGLQHTKSLLTVKQAFSFLDIIAQQALHMDVPLLLMNSFATERESLMALKRYPDLCRDNFPISFRQHKIPKIQQKDLSPAIWSENPQLEWCPPGHGDIYIALVTSGRLAELLAAGYEYAFVSNADNLGAVVDPKILGYFVQHQYPFLMEVADRTQMDKKGGHLARRRDGQLILREAAQCPANDLSAFQDVQRHRYFNTNNLWLHLPTLQRVLVDRDYKLGLPMIRNAKTVDPRNSHSPAVYQLETAMGSAIAVFKGAQAIRVPRSRFAPVKTTNDLLAVRSDAYELTDDFRIVTGAGRQMRRFVIALDPMHYKFVTDLDAAFPKGMPSLIGCKRFEITGAFCFGRNITCKGEVLLTNTSDKVIAIADDTILEGVYHYPS